MGNTIKQTIKNLSEQTSLNRYANYIVGYGFRKQEETSQVYGNIDIYLIISKNNHYKFVKYRSYSSKYEDLNINTIISSFDARPMNYWEALRVEKLKEKSQKDQRIETKQELMFETTMPRLDFTSVVSILPNVSLDKMKTSDILRYGIENENIIANITNKLFQSNRMVITSLAKQLQNVSFFINDFDQETKRKILFWIKDAATSSEELINRLTDFQKELNKTQTKMIESIDFCEEDINSVYRVIRNMEQEIKMLSDVISNHKNGFPEQHLLNDHINNADRRLMSLKLSMQSGLSLIMTLKFVLNEYTNAFHDLNSILSHLIPNFQKNLTITDILGNKQFVQKIAQGIQAISQNLSSTNTYMISQQAELNNRLISEVTLQQHSNIEQDTQGKTIATVGNKVLK